MGAVITSSANLGNTTINRGHAQQTGTGDGIPDCNQPNVVSFHTEDGNNYVTLAAPDGTIFTDVQALSAPAPGIFSSRISFPYGMFRFRLNGVTPGGAVQTALFLSVSIPVD